jgi:hypothetical protein
MIIQKEDCMNFYQLAVLSSLVAVTASCKTRSYNSNPKTEDSVPQSTEQLENPQDEKKFVQFALCETFGDASKASIGFIVDEKDKAIALKIQFFKTSQWDWLQRWKNNPTGSVTALLDEKDPPTWWQDQKSMSFSVKKTKFEGYLTFIEAGTGLKSSRDVKEPYLLGGIIKNQGAALIGLPVLDGILGDAGGIYVDYDDTPNHGINIDFGKCKRNDATFKKYATIGRFP